jgi:hypothetical protein
MTISEIITEAMSKETGEEYAGGMTANDIESIKAESAELRRFMAAKGNPHGTSGAIS